MGSYAESALALVPTADWPGPAGGGAQGGIAVAVNIAFELSANPYADWTALRRQGHAMLDAMFDHLEHRRDAPVWQPIPADIRNALHTDSPRAAAPLEDVHAEFARAVMPYATGNTHPGFMGWVHGGGTAVGMLAEMLAAGLNANLGGRDHMPIEVERQVARWARDWFGFPDSADGLFVTGTSMANLMAVLIARTAALGGDVRRSGLGENGGKLRAYASRAAHGCVPRAMDFAGLGSEALRLVPTDASFRIDVDALARAILEDRAAGLTPFLVIGTAGAVDTGATDDLAALADLCGREGLRFHVDGAFGALGILVSGNRAAAGRHRAGGFDRLRFPQMGPGAL